MNSHEYIQFTTTTNKKASKANNKRLIAAYQTSSRNSSSVILCRGRSSSCSSRHIITVSFKLLLPFTFKQFCAGLIDAPGSHWPLGCDNGLSPEGLSRKMHSGGLENDMLISSNTHFQYIWNNTQQQWQKLLRKWKQILHKCYQYTIYKLFPTPLLSGIYIGPTR